MKILLLLVLVLPLFLEVSADEKCYYFNTCLQSSPTRYFTVSYLINNTVINLSGSVTNSSTDDCEQSEDIVRMLAPIMCGSSNAEPKISGTIALFYFFPVNEDSTFDDYPAICQFGKSSAINAILSNTYEVYDVLINEAMNKCPILNNITGCPNVKPFQNDMFTFAALKNNTVFYSSTSTINKAGRCDMSILYPCLCRPSYDEPVFFFLPDYESFVDYPAMCIVGEKANKIYQFGSDLEIYDLLLSKKIEYMPKSLINPFIIDNNTTNSSCTDMNGNPTKDVNGQKTCMISFSDESDEFMYAGPLIGSSMLDFDDNENFKKSDIVKSCPSNKNVSKFQLLDKSWTDWCFWKNSFSKLKFQCCCVKNPTLCSPPRMMVNETNYLLCLHSLYYEKKGLMKTKKAENFLKRFSACAVRLFFGYDDKNNADFQIWYYGDKKCDKSKSTKISVYDPSIICSSKLEMIRNITVIKCCTDGHFCNHKFVPENYETTECSHQNRMEQIAMGTSDSTCTHFFDLRIENFTKILLGYNAEIPDGQPRKFNQTSSNNQSFIYDLNYVYAKILKVDNSTLCPIRHYNESGEYRPIIQVSCEGNKCDENIFHDIPFDIPQFQCQNLSEPFVKDGKYEAVMENSVGWICYVEIKNFTVHAGELKDFTNHTECLETDVFQSGEDESFCCSNVFNDSQSNRSCTIEKLIEKSPDLATPDNQKDDLISQYYCDIKNVPNIPCSDPGCFISRLPEHSDDSNPIEPAGCIQNAEKYIIDDKDNSQMASISLACKSAEWNGCSLLKDVEGNERIVCCCNGNECDKLQRTVPEKVGKPVSSYRSH